MIIGHVLESLHCVVVSAAITDILDDHHILIIRAGGYFSFSGNLLNGAAKAAVGAKTAPMVGAQWAQGYEVE